MSDSQMPSDATNNRPMQHATPTSVSTPVQTTTITSLPSDDRQNLSAAAHSLAYLEGPAPPFPGQTVSDPTPEAPTRYFEGISSNAQILGISRADLLDANAQSPFTSPGYDESALENVSISLRPTLIQRRFKHHPFFDCIAIPAFRDKLVLSSTTEPPLINRFDICYDMFAGGLTFLNDPSSEENWRFSNEFETKWGALLQMEVSNLLRHVEGVQSDSSRRST